MTTQRERPFSCASQAHVWTAIVLSCLAFGLGLANLALLLAAVMR